MTAVAQKKPSAPRRSPESEIAAAIDLGWRVAALHTLDASKLVPSPATGDLLLNRRSFGAADRLELELRAIAGVAVRVGVPLARDDLQALVDLVPDAARSPAGEDLLRVKLAHTHVAFAKRLWAQEEARGRAYELGNFVSDTWNRVLRPRTTPSAQTELQEIFSAERVRLVKTLLDNLQTRLDPTAVHVVESHLDAWQERVAAQPPAAQDGAAAPTPDEAAEAYEPLERQTIIWRQILTGDKEPEAYIDHAKRAEVRDELSRQLWRRYRRLWPVVPIVAALGGAIGYLLASESFVAAAPLIGTLTAVGGMLGITRASMIATAKRGLQDWGELMWNRSLAAVICRETLTVEELLGPPAPTSTRMP